ncbi:DM13 domain-containing protein [Corynebacterium sp. CCM 9185]|nr:DM13 domain-containing protein [Corynebacterium marambiense]MCK7662480.1 DM13 domain-containing protein [Corynebacterium marambiense]
MVVADMPLTQNAARKPLYIALIALIMVIAIGIALALTQPWRAFTSSSVDEAFPSTGDAVATAPGDETVTVGESTDLAAVDTVKPVKPVKVKRGQVISLDHDTSGTAFIAELPDGSRVLRLEDLASLDGPDLKVVLTPAVGDYSTLGDTGYVTLGELKATHGNQNYTIPADLDLNTANSVVIWCERFSSAFGAAELTVI